MPRRTENDIKNRWNSIVRRPQAPCGRSWSASENELRASYLGLTVESLEGVNGWKRPRVGPSAPSPSRPRLAHSESREVLTELTNAENGRPKREVAIMQLEPTGQPAAVLRIKL